MSKLFLLSKTQMERLTPHFPLAHGVPCVDDRLVASGEWHHLRHPQWPAMEDAPKSYVHEIVRSLINAGDPQDMISGLVASTVCETERINYPCVAKPARICPPIPMER